MRDSVDTSKPTPKVTHCRRWYQFSLRTACALLLVISLHLGAFAWWRDRAERQRKVVEELRGLGAFVSRRYFSLTKSYATHDAERLNQRAVPEMSFSFVPGFALAGETTL